MIVTTDIPRAKATDRGLDPVPYSYAAPFASSFIAILNEMSPRGGEIDSGRGDRDGERTTTSAAETGAPSEATTEAALDGTVDETAPDAVEETKAPAVGDDAAPEPPGEDSGERPVAVADAVAENVTSESDAATPATAENLDDSTALLPKVPATVDGTPTPGALAPETVVPVVETDAPVLTVPPAPPRLSGTEPAAITDADSATAPVDAVALAVDGEASASPPAAAPFPKTLNALLAERAVRNGYDAADAPDLNPTVAHAPEEPAPLADESELPAPAPQVARPAAMELGGVRTETASGPRIPLANLPGELAQQLHLMQQEGVKTMRLRLMPEHLGEIHIEIHGHGDTMRVRMVSANPAVRDALESQMGDLRQALQKQGLSLDTVTVDAGPGHEERPQRHDPGHRSPRSSATPPPGGVSVNETRSAASPGNAGEAPGTLNLLA